MNSHLLNRVGIIGRLLGSVSRLVSYCENVLTGGEGDGRPDEGSTGYDNHVLPNVILPLNHLFSLTISKIESYV